MEKVPARPRTWIVCALVLALAGSTLAIVAIPVWLVHPFKPQTPGGLTLALTLRSWAPIATVGLAVVCAALVAVAWRRVRWPGRAALALVLAPVMVSVWFARQNYFEWMFRPLAEPAFAELAEASFVEDADTVIAVEVGGDAVAFPVRQVAYHHLAHATVGGRPIVVTY